MNTSRPTTEGAVGNRRDQPHSQQEIDDALRRVLDALDAAGEQNRDAERRKHPRYVFRIPRFTIEIENAGSLHQIPTCTRNLSVGGMAFITNTQLAAGTRCKASLPKLDGTKHAVTGHVIASRKISKKYFEVGMKFEAEIQPFDFVDAGQKPTM